MSLISQASSHLPLLFMLALTACMIWVIISDAVHYIISNAVNAIILVLYILGVVLLPIDDSLYALLAAGIILAVGLLFFTFGLMGGGDVKLLVVLTLWTGWGATTVEFLFLTTLTGGLLVIVVLMLRATVPALWIKRWPTKNLPRLFTRKQPVPYGIAIAGAFIWVLWMGAVPGLKVS